MRRYAYLCVLAEGKERKNTHMYVYTYDSNKELYALDVLRTRYTRTSVIIQVYYVCNVFVYRTQVYGRATRPRVGLRG
jgi:hypothetical protein